MGPASDCELSKKWRLVAPGVLPEVLTPVTLLKGLGANPDFFHLYYVGTHAPTADSPSKERLALYDDDDLLHFAPPDATDLLFRIEQVPMGSEDFQPVVKYVRGGKKDRSLIAHLIARRPRADESEEASGLRHRGSKPEASTGSASGSTALRLPSSTAGGAPRDKDSLI